MSKIPVTIQLGFLGQLL